MPDVLFILFYLFIYLFFKLWLFTKTTTSYDEKKMGKEDRKWTLCYSNILK